jgi:putative molybdopterin biosynthesis protein
LCWERFDLLIGKDRFFDQGIQLFLSLLKGKVIQSSAEEYGGYDLSLTGKMVYPEPAINQEDLIPGQAL